MESSKLFNNLCSISLLFKAWETVKKKNAGGGIDGTSVQDFDINAPKNIQAIQQELAAGKWIPQPYFRVCIPKKNNEIRELGLLTVKDKIIQQALLMLLEPKVEHLFVNNSYGYRPEKGALKAIKRTLWERNNKTKNWVLKLDIDNFFDNVNHSILETRVHACTTDPEIVRLIMLCVKMGVVSKSMNWKDSVKGLPQGAILSPVLANLYLHSFDQFILTRTTSYVRYADDFVIFTSNEEEIDRINDEATKYLNEKLKLTLNEPVKKKIEEGFEFLGITINKGSHGISPEKKTELLERIKRFELTATGMERQCTRSWEGITAYYSKLLDENTLEELDQALFQNLSNEITQKWKDFGNKNILKNILDKITFTSTAYKLKNNELKKGLLQIYLECKKTTAEQEADKENQKIIQQRKREYQKKEISHSELVINKLGVSVGYTKAGITVKEKGKLLFKVPTNNLKHITISSNGISLSSNFIFYTLKNRIPLDFFDYSGKHLGTFLSSSALQASLWQAQAQMSVEKRNILAASIIDGKLNNQLNLIKYFHKYHKQNESQLATSLNSIQKNLQKYKEYLKQAPFHQKECIIQIMAFEAQGAQRYWNYIKTLLADDNIIFNGRIHQGAEDPVNAMLNYGYAILYARVWKSLLKFQLNPYDSVIHVRQSSKPTFVYDIVEIFRPQAVDRVIISMIQRNEPVEIKNKLITEETKKLLIQNITERLYRREMYRNEKISFQTIIELQVKNIAEYIQHDTKFKVYKSKW